MRLTALRTAAARRTGSRRAGGPYFEINETGFELDDVTPNPVPIERRGLRVESVGQEYTDSKRICGFAAQKSEKLAQVVHGGLGREVEGRVGLEYIKAKFLKHPHSPQETINYENEEDV